MIVQLWFAYVTRIIHAATAINEITEYLVLNTFVWISSSIFVFIAKSMRDLFYLNND